MQSCVGRYFSSSNVSTWAPELQFIIMTCLILDAVLTAEFAIILKENKVVKNSQNWACLLANLLIELRFVLFQSMLINFTGQCLCKTAKLYFFSIVYALTVIITSHVKICFKLIAKMKIGSYETDETDLVCVLTDFRSLFPLTTGRLIF